MRNSQLWPVVGALVALVAGSLVAEFSARHRGSEALHIHITDNRAEGGEDDLGAELSEAAGTVLGAEHALARQLVKRREFTSALSTYRRLIQEYPDNPSLLAEYAHSLFRAGSLKEARQHLDQALQLSPNDGRIVLELGLIDQSEGDIAGAEKNFRHALELRRNDSGARRALGELLYKRKDLAGAIEVLTPAASSGSNEERARSLALLARCEMTAGNHDRADKLVEQAIQRAPASVNTWIRSAYVYLESPRPNALDVALEHALTAVKLAPALAIPYRLVATIHERRGATQEALDAYKHSLEFDPSNERSRRRILKLSLREGDIAEARKQAATLLNMKSEDAEFLFLAGLVETRAGQYGQAIKNYLRAVDARNGDYAEAWFNLGNVYRKSKQYDTAIDAYSKAIEQRDNYSAAWNGLGKVYAEAGQREEAERSYKTAISIQPDHRIAWRNLGHLYYKEARYAEAASTYAKAVELRPSDRGLSLNYAIAQRKAGHRMVAIKTYRKLLQQHPRYVKAWYNLGVALEAGRDFAEAKGAYKTALSYQPDHAGSLKNLGYVEAQLGETKPALEHLNAALDRSPSDYEARLKLAEIHLLNSDTSSCRIEVNKVLTHTPQNTDARSLLRRCQD